MAKQKLGDKKKKLALDGDPVDLVDDKKSADKENNKSGNSEDENCKQNLHADNQTDRELVTDILIPDSDVLEFICPNCGKISQNDVIFLCNTCDNSELIFKDGIYMCPQCLYPGDNFECMKCENKHVRMRHVKN